VPECPASRIKDACALRSPGSPRNIPIKAGLQIVIIEKPLQFRPVMRNNRVGLVMTGQIDVGSRVGRPHGTGRPRHGSSSFSASDEGWSPSIIVSVGAARLAKASSGG
jgi:hypothetical protein